MPKPPVESSFPGAVRWIFDERDSAVAALCAYCGQTLATLPPDGQLRAVRDAAIVRLLFCCAMRRERGRPRLTAHRPPISARTPLLAVTPNALAGGSNARAWA